MRPILIEDDDLRAIWRLLAGNYDVVEAKANCSDGLTHTTDNLDDLLELGSIRSRQIDRIEFTGRSNAFKEHVILSVGVGPLSDATASVDVDSEQEEKTRRVVRESLALLNEATTGYNLVASDWVSFPSILVGLAFWYSVFGVGVMPMVVGAGTGFWLGSQLQKVQRWLLPRTFFAIGKQRERWDVLKRRRSTAIGLLVALAIGVAGSLIAAYLWEHRK